jgi:hypothetical protein
MLQGLKVNKKRKDAGKDKFYLWKALDPVDVVESYYFDMVEEQYNDDYFDGFGPYRPLSILELVFTQKQIKSLVVDPNDSQYTTEDHPDITPMMFGEVLKPSRIIPICKVYMEKRKKGKHTVDTLHEDWVQSARGSSKFGVWYK